MKKRDNKRVPIMKFGIAPPAIPIATNEKPRMFVNIQF